MIKLFNTYIVTQVVTQVATQVVIYKMIAGEKFLIYLVLELLNHIARSVHGAYIVLFYLEPIIKMDIILRYILRIRC